VADGRGCGAGRPPGAPSARIWPSGARELAVVCLADGRASAARGRRWGAEGSFGLASQEMSQSAFERIGGEPALRAIIHDFVERIFADVMIGFFFRRASRQRIEEMEYQHAAEHLGAPLRYGGRPLREAHAAHRIMGGQFERRKKILADVLSAHGVPDDIRQGWLEHVESLRPLITGDPGSQCR
jgi:hemoglobin